MKKTHRIGSIFLNCFIAIVVLLLIVVVANIVYTNTHPDTADTFLGYRPIIITSDSMEDTIMTGAVILVHKTPYEDLVQGNIITFQSTSLQDFNTHRIIRVADEGLATKGDNAQEEDRNLVTRGNYQYKVVAICNWWPKLQRWPDALFVLAWPGAVIAGSGVLIYAISHAFGRRKQKTGGIT